MDNKQVHDLVKQLASAAYHAQRSEEVNSDATDYFKGQYHGLCKATKLLTGYFPTCIIRDYHVKVYLGDLRVRVGIDSL